MHYFDASGKEERDLHGLALCPDRFRNLERPDPVLIAWHYTQAVRMRIRGYSIGMRRPRMKDVTEARGLHSDSV